MKKIANLKGVRALCKSNQKAVNGGDYNQENYNQICGYFPFIGYISCPRLETCIKGKCHAL